MLKYLYIILFCSPLFCFGQSDVYQEINRIRKKHLLPALKVDTILEKESQNWVNRIIKNGRKLTHDHISNRYEVLARCEDPVDGWMNSKTHRKILLKRGVKRIGFYIKDGISCARLQ